MIRAAMIVLVLTAIAWGVFLAATLVEKRAPPSPPSEPLPPPRTVRTLSPPEKITPLPQRYACSASGCHGAIPSEDVPAWQSAFASWSASDPHALAHAVLYSERSQNMVRMLGGPESSGDGAYEAFLADRCAACHATGGSSAADEPVAAKFDLSSGVRCEACHGAPDGWFYEHRLTDWAERTPEAKSALGFHDTEHPGARAASCASCHVGSPGRDVNHDLIAAGHPRLNFEFAAYWQALPKHWEDAHEQMAARERLGLDAASPPAELAAATWTAGQFASAKTWLTLLKSRAATHPWPEFAAHDCAACHHDLRPQDLAAISGRGSAENLGVLRLGAWDLAMPRLLAGSAAPNNGAPAEFSQALQNLEAEMNQSLPDPGRIETLCEEALQALAALSPRGDNDVRRRLLRALVKEADARGRMSWDEAAQWRLAVDALRGEMGLGETLRELHEVLNARGDHGPAMQAVAERIQSQLEP